MPNLYTKYRIIRKKRIASPRIRRTKEVDLFERSVKFDIQELWLSNDKLKERIEKLEGVIVSLMMDTKST